VNEDTQLLYKNTKGSTSCVTCIDDEYIVTGSDQSTIDLWSLKKKKPIYRVHNAQIDTEITKSSWVTCVQAIRNTDLLVSGGINSKINLYKLDKNEHNLQLVK